MAAQPPQLRRYQRQQKRAAIRRVQRYTRWLKEGADIRKMPQPPKDNDYAVARAARKVR